MSLVFAMAFQIKVENFQVYQWAGRPNFDDRA